MTEIRRGDTGRPVFVLQYLLGAAPTEVFDEVTETVRLRRTTIHGQYLRPRKPQVRLSGSCVSGSCVKRRWHPGKVYSRSRLSS